MTQIDVEKLSPMMAKYLETKEEYRDCILFYRLGDFYEMFFDDAELVSKELELTLTGKSCGLEERAPMCGVPFHAVDTYLNQLVEKGYKVAICEQVEDPKLAKGLVKREVTRVVTPGTNLSAQALEESKNHFLMCIFALQDKIGVSFADISTGEFYLTESDNINKLCDEIQKLEPAEIICNDMLCISSPKVKELVERLSIPLYELGSWYFEHTDCEKTLTKHFKVSSLVGLGISDFTAGMIASGALLQYLYETQKIPLTHITRLIPYTGARYMLLDGATRRNLELTETMREKQKRGTLFWVLDKTRTAMGARMLRNDIEQPLVDEDAILERQDAIEELCRKSVDRDEIREYLNAIYDLERLLSRVSYHSVNPRDMIALRNSLAMLPAIRNILADMESSELKGLYEGIDDLADITERIRTAIIEECPRQYCERNEPHPDDDCPSSRPPCGMS